MMRAAVVGLVVGMVVGAARGAAVEVVLGERGDSAAVVVAEGMALAHTDQVVGVDVPGAMGKLEEVLKRAGAGRVVKLNVVAVDGTVLEAARGWVRARYLEGERPAVMGVVSRVVGEGMRVGVDAVAVGGREVEGEVGVLPAGGRVYVSGQAEKGASAGEGARKTVESLKRTLEFAGCNVGDVVQVKCFVTSVKEAGEVRRAVEEGLGRRVPMVLVEWVSAGVPVEIEMVVKTNVKEGAAGVEYLTPPGMTASPVFARVVRVNRGDVIYVGEVVGSEQDQEAAGLFEKLKEVVGRAGGDMRHLVKGTYYVRDEAASQAFNKVRPGYYDAACPPAASKAMVAGVGREGRGMSLDMIAVRGRRD